MEPFVWVKAKYLAPKQRGRYAGGANAAPKKNRNKKGPKVAPTFRNVMVLSATSNKITWVREAL